MRYCNLKLRYNSASVKSTAFHWYRENDALYIYICHSNFIVLLPHISPWTQSWIQAFIVAYEKLTFKSVKQNCWFRNQPWDAVKSHQALKKGSIKSTNQNAIFFARIYQTPIWIGTKITPFSDWYIYKPVDMPHKWIGSTPK